MKRIEITDCTRTVGGAGMEGKVEDEMEEN